MVYEIISLHSCTGTEESRQPAFGVHAEFNKLRYRVTHTCQYACPYIHTRTHQRMHAHMNACMYAHTHTHHRALLRSRDREIHELQVSKLDTLNPVLCMFVSVMTASCADLLCSSYI